jgi:Spy/CpxP family protein refolding chaperone
MKISRFILSVLVPAFLAMPLVAAAQSTNAPEGAARQRPPGASQNPNISGIALGGPVGVLTDQQRTSYEAALGRQREVMIKLQAQLRAAREDFTAASVDQKFDENVMRQKALAAARIEAEMAVIRAHAMSEVQPPLTAEQIQKVKAGQPGPMRPYQVQPQQQRRLEQGAPHATGSTNQDANGLPPKK